MKTLYTIILIALWLTLQAVPTIAIDKTKRDTTLSRTKKPFLNPDTGAAGAQAKKKPPKKAPDLGGKIYDDFIDKNQNGIDDRSEKRIPAQPKKESVVDSTQTSPPKK